MTTEKRMCPICKKDYTNIGLHVWNKHPEYTEALEAAAQEYLNSPGVTSIPPKNSVNDSKPFTPSRAVGIRDLIRNQLETIFELQLVDMMVQMKKGAIQPETAQSMSVLANALKPGQEFSKSDFDSWKAEFMQQQEQLKTAYEKGRQEAMEDDAEPEDGFEQIVKGIVQTKLSGHLLPSEAQPTIGGAQVPIIR